MAAKKTYKGTVGIDNTTVAPAEGSIDYRRQRESGKMADSDKKKLEHGHMNIIDSLPSGDPRLAWALDTYAQYIDQNKTSLMWERSTRWTENILFMGGRHYISDILTNKLSTSSTSGQPESVIRDITTGIPQPTNDILGRLVETNVALLTENKPIPRITPRSGRADDEEAAEISELTVEYLWEALDMPQKHRQLARIMISCGVCWLELDFDPAKVRRIQVPKTKKEPAMAEIPGIEGAPSVRTAVERDVPVLDEEGKPVLESKLEYGDITATIISPFEMHLPPIHWWNSEELGWTLREYYTPIEALKDKYGRAKTGAGLTKKKGWYLDNLGRVGTQDVQNLPVWWWERLGQMVEGPGQNFFAGSPELWKEYTIVRIFDRKPNHTWPNGRTVIVAGGQVIYDSPKEIGARAYDPRWPDRWHPYVIFRWEPLPTTDIYCRSLVSKLLPKLKRVNSIDTTLIMWRRTVPTAAWIVPKGTSPIEDFFSGKTGSMLEYDPRRTANQKPEPVPPTPFPAAALEERVTQIREMEMIAGTEEILHGQRPTGTTSGAMLNALRKATLVSKSAILQDWDESLQAEAGHLLRLVVRNIGESDTYLRSIQRIAKDKFSKLTLDHFSGENLADNVTVKIDTASMAMVSKEANEAKALEFLQYAPNLMGMPIGLRNHLIEQLGMEKGLVPQGRDVHRAKRLIALIKQESFERVIPMNEDDPYVFADFFTEEVQSDEFYNISEDSQKMMLRMLDIYKQQVQMREEQMMQMQIMMMQLQGNKGGRPPGGGGGGGAPGGGGPR